LIGLSSCTLYEDGSIRGHNVIGCLIPEMGCRADLRPVKVLTEDDPEWDCHVDGNQICGPVRLIPPVTITAP
jgi:hypothetical protein